MSLGVCMLQSIGSQRVGLDLVTKPGWPVRVLGCDFKAKELLTILAMF